MANDLATRKQAVGEFVREYRKRNPKYTHDYIKAHGGPSGPAITRIERGEGARPHTFMGLEQALDLPEGTLIAIVNGDPPPPKEPDVATALAHLSDEQLLAELQRRLSSRVAMSVARSARPRMDPPGFSIRIPEDARHSHRWDNER